MENENTWDAVVVGGSAAGLSAALMLGRARRRTLVVDAGSPRNRFADHMHGVLGQEGVPPAGLMRRGREEVAAYGVEVLDGIVERVEDAERGLLLTLAGGRTLTARAVVVATGISDELPDVPGLAERWGDTVLHCPYCHGWEVRGQRLGVLTTSPQGLHQAELVRQWTDHLVVFTAGLGPLDPATTHRLRSRGIQLRPAAVTEVTDGPDGALLVRTDDGDETVVDAIFTAGAPLPHDGFLAPLGLDRTETPWGSFLTVDPTGRTSHERVWAAGNVVNAGANVPLSLGTGSFAGAAANAALVAEDFDTAAAAPVDDGEDPARFWEERYAGAGNVWSGRPNATVVQVVSGLEPGRALDLGCGEGADVVWLARQGWRATGLDISATAVDRARRAAAAAGLPDDEARFEVADLSAWEPSAAYDLVTAAFFQSPVHLPRAEVLRRAAAAVVPGGHLLVVTHATVPPWAAGPDAGGEHEHQAHTGLLSPQEQVEEIALDPGAWEVVLAETRDRAATGPDGQEAVLEDGVVLLRRR
ncbi:SAM-dependent methyltransferase [Xylanimonas oleitrophica]|uniref:SAM-dependent methyltransferase n=1 Tax=Xylanimonas oleitrophica TaxID=2607479 RepID=A0A2W5WUV3_9MICO|nr:FAD-dependent oxidoreductase [Xylanimonas oleitrophica]PZR54403.1 SAM-dependent methyltransferase [Xylanimonas oleitrophica]